MFLDKLDLLLLVLLRISDNANEMSYRNNMTVKVRINTQFI